MPADQKQQIENAIKRFADGNLFENAENLFNVLKYDTRLQAPLDDPSWEGFQQTYVSNGRFNEKMALTSDWKYVNILFQLSESAIKQQINLFSSGRFDSSIMYSFLYICIKLSKDHYTKTQLSQITREINKVFAMPVMILFKTGNGLTLSLINRRLHKRDETRDVLEKITLIKDISIQSPHRAHIEILFDVSFNELYRIHGFTNFVEMHQGWQKTLDTKELNKRFFKELFNWYLWAIRNVRFPNKVDDSTDDMAFNQEAVIRLLTRLIFIWFIKEKNLVPDHLFNVRFLQTILREFDPQSSEKSNYYRAILQNLFFATLNTPMDNDITDENRDEKRGFIVPGMPGGRANPHFTDQTRYRYKEYFINEEKALKLFETIPFLNGGLFECLDFPPDDGQPEIRIDGFSTRKDKQAFVPDMLFFNEEFVFDLNEEYGTKGKQYKVKGLIPIFSGYKFTITENTPLEEEVALDPELLGKVFENLLATYNPETRTTARKQTGSFYTPREIVNYMVDESLIAFFYNTLTKDQTGTDSGKVETEQRLRYLFSPEGNGHDFNEEETRQLIHTLSHCRILDPACGSGAFPMGILHRMVDLLGKLDPENDHWKEIQKERALQETKEAYEIGDKQERHHRLEEINKAFDESINNPDYARKLFLIENCIYGVDIQQIAVQIAKLRFFISLIAEQKVDDNKPNRNILSMPNLETKFVAANTLIELEKPEGQLSLMSMDPAIEEKEKELKAIREKIFFTRRYHDKKQLKQEEKKCREELRKILIDNNMSKTSAEQMAGWNPFDPLRSSPFFDVETMFGFTGGFDVVIGNPPYMNFRNIKSREEKNYYFSNFTTVEYQSDLYVLFIERGFGLLRNKKGTLTLIIPNAITNNLNNSLIRKFILENSCINSIVNTPLGIFETATVDTVIICTSLGKQAGNLKCIEIKNDHFILLSFKNQNEFFTNHNYFFDFLTPDFLKEITRKIEIDTVFLDDICNSSSGIKEYETGKGIPPQSESDREKKIFNSNVKLNSDYWPHLTGSEIDNYQVKWNNSYLKYGPWIAAPRDKKYFIGERIIIREIPGISSLKVAYTNEDYTVKNTAHIFISKNKNYSNKYLCALLNSNLIGFYFKQKFSESDNVFPKAKIGQCRLLPIKKTPQQIIFEKILNIIVTCIKKNIDFEYFKSLIDYCVYEIYFPSQIQFAGCEVLKHLKHLPELKEECDDAKKLAIIGQVYHELSDPSHPVSIAMERMKEVEEVRIIEESVHGTKGVVQS